tara:strand:- start:623 stop:778 length:156 start_codon:yes stop_codon:yes gene_type:complete
MKKWRNNNNGGNQHKADKLWIKARNWKNKTKGKGKVLIDIKNNTINYLLTP